MNIEDNCIPYKLGPIGWLLRILPTSLNWGEKKQSIHWFPPKVVLFYFGYLLSNLMSNGYNTKPRRSTLLQIDWTQTWGCDLGSQWWWFIEKDLHQPWWDDYTGTGYMLMWMGGAHLCWWCFITQAPNTTVLYLGKWSIQTFKLVVMN